MYNLGSDTFGHIYQGQTVCITHADREPIGPSL